MSGLPSVYSLPLHTLRLAVRCLFPLLIWFTAGELVRWGLIAGGAELSHGSLRDVRQIGVMLLFTIMVMVSLVVTVGLLYCLRAGLWEMRARSEAGEREEPFRDSLSRTLLVFIGLYFAWGLRKDDASDFLSYDIEHNEDFAASVFAGKESEAGTGLLLDPKIALVLSGVFLVLRLLLRFLNSRRESRTRTFLLAFCELAFVFYGLAVVVTWLSPKDGWLGDRVVVTWWNDLLEAGKAAIPGWDAAWGFLGAYAFDALILPLIGFTVAILVYGASVEDTRKALAGTRVEGAVNVMGERTHEYTRKGLSMITGGIQEKWVPILNALRLMVRGGAPLFGLMCLCYVGIRVGADYGTRGVLLLVGNGEHQLFLGKVLMVPILFVKEFVIIALTMCLYAATFDLAATRQRAFRLRELSERTADTVRRAGVRPDEASALPSTPQPTGR